MCGPDRMQACLVVALVVTGALAAMAASVVMGVRAGGDGDGSGGGGEGKEVEERALAEGAWVGWRWRWR